MDDGREDKLPWTKWSWSDWAADYGLRASSLAAKGLWMEMLSIMARSKRKGYLLDGEKQMESKTLANIVSIPTDEADCLINELRSHGVFSESADGIIYNRRMAREGEISEIRAECGKHGGRPKSKTEANEKQNESKGKATRESKTKGPSYSSSISTSLSSLISKWNSFSLQHHLPSIQSISKGSAREKHLLARMSEDGFDFDNLLSTIAEQPFLLGQNKQGWSVTFDWIICPSNYQKIIERNYRDKNNFGEMAEWAEEKAKQ